MFNLSQLPTFALFSIWQEVNVEEYRQTVDKFIFRSDFDIVPFIKKMICNYNPTYYKQFCELFDEQKVYDKVKALKPNSIRDYRSTVGYFIGRHLPNARK